MPKGFKVSYHGPVIQGDYNQIAWDNQTVHQQLIYVNEAAAAKLALVVTELLEELQKKSISDRDRADIQTTARELLSEARQQRPLLERLKPSLAKLKGFLITAAMSVVSSKVQRWIEVMLNKLNVPLGHQ
ncbi:MAG: hypothetical protein ACRD3Q_07810 [Terriglobales bacterium]